MAGSTTTTLNDLLPQIVAEALFVASERSIMRPLVKNFALGPSQGKTVTVPIYPTQTAATLTEGDEVSNSEVATSGATLTIQTNAIRTMVTDLAVASSASNVVADLGRLFGEAIARKMDVDLMALFDGFSVALGDGTGAVTPAAIFNAVAKLRSAGVPLEGIACVLHPAIAYDLKAALTTQGNTAFAANGTSNDVANQALREGLIGRLAGIPVYESGNMANTGTAGDFKGGVFHRDALGLAMIGDISIETQRRASFVGTDVVAYAHYGVGEIYDGYGVELHYDSSIL
jgi:N4-gp56 family major capsid protein